MKLDIKKERFHENKFKEELLDSHSSDKHTFKDLSGIKNAKNIINNLFNEHFNPEALKDQGKDRVKEKVKISNKITTRFDKKKVKSRKIIGLLSDFTSKLGYDENPRNTHTKILKYVSYFQILLSLLLMIIVFVNHKSLDVLITFLIVLWTLVFAIIYLIVLFGIFMYLDVRMYQCVREIEESLPDFLQLASANISAGMTIDRSLWYAIRPKFGILAVEMENVAKATIAGEDLEKALVKLGGKYDSRILKETINLIVEGISSGGEMAQLLNKLSVNIKETQLMRKEISASVTTYAIFIGIATVVAAPLLFALSTELLLIIQKIFSTIHIDKSVGSSALFSFNFSSESITIGNFQRFAIMVLVISSFFSASIISVIRKGSVKEGVKTIPLFIIVSIIIYYVSFSMFQMLMGSIF
jgi:Flp pilus assembly protein TadB